MPLSADPPPAAVGQVAGAVAPLATPAVKKEPDTEVSGIVVIPPKPVSPPAWSAKLNFDPQGIYQQSDTPYLRVRPIDSCKLMAGGAQPGRFGKAGAAGGVVCVKRF